MASFTPKIKTLLILAKNWWKIKLKFSRSALFHMKARVFLKYFVHGYSKIRYWYNFNDNNKNKKQNKNEQSQLNETYRLFLSVSISCTISIPNMSTKSSACEISVLHSLSTELYLIFIYH